MNEVWLLSGFLMLTVLALCGVFYHHRKSRKALFFAPVLMALVGFSYWHWGAWPAWVNHLNAQEKQKRIQALLSEMKGPDALIDKLKMTLRKHPESARGWYLLGRLYASQDQWIEAGNAFERAHALKPEDDLVSVNYAQSLWQLNDQAFNKKSRAVLIGVLKHNPNQPDALAMLATDAYQRHYPQQAIHYWRQLLTQLPPNAEEAQAIRKAMTKASSLLKK